MSEELKDTESAIDEAGHTLLADLAGIDCYDTNLRDQPAAYAALDRYREACAKIATQATPDAAEAGKDALQNTAPRRIYLDIGDQFALERVLSGGISWQSLEGVTWSEDNATSHGVEYLRADLAAQEAAAVQAVGAEPTPEMVKRMVVAWLSQPPGLPWDDCAIAAWKAGVAALPAGAGEKTS